jgi:CRP/FNR family transcriptional regulator
MLASERILMKRSGPSLRAAPFLRGDTAASADLLTPRQRRQLAAIATRVRVPARKLLYREGAAAKWIFLCGEGVVKAFRELPSGKRRITAFMFAGDIFGLAENGRYVNSTRTVTAVTLYRIRVEDLSAVLRRDPDLQYQIICKVTHQLRESHRRAIVLGRRDAAGRFAMFLTMLEQHPPCTPGSTIIPVPMSRSDIAEYLGLSLEAVSRATRSLTREGIISFHDRHTVRIRNRPALDRLAVSPDV